MFVYKSLFIHLHHHFYCVLSYLPSSYNKLYIIINAGVSSDEFMIVKGTELISAVEISTEICNRPGLSYLSALSMVIGHKSFCICNCVASNGKYWIPTRTHCDFVKARLRLKCRHLLADRVSLKNIRIWTINIISNLLLVPLQITHLCVLTIN